jgi:hypothetical protein
VESVTSPGVTFRLLDGGQAAEHEDELRALRREVYGENGESSSPAGQFRVQRRQPGFVLAEARHGGYLVGYASGMPLRPSTSWWRHLTTPLPAEVTAEHPGRTFALTELAVLVGLILTGRPEERATLTVLPGAAPAQHAFRTWGWSKVARTRGPEPGSPALDVLVIDLPYGLPAMS